MTEGTHITLTAPTGLDMALVVGPADANLHLIQSNFDARVTVRGDSIIQVLR